MPLFKNKEKAKDKDAERQEKIDSREEKTSNRRSFRIEKIHALKEKALAVAAKRKWLVFILGLGLIIYFAVSSGGMGGIGPILEKVKGFFGFAM
tara:strand:+ start:98 stop:379 length:282 start_codon:yes stop_codon:yes gene_type:complete